ncbi:MAG: HEAT repeat domain-containing protein [Bacteroidota bacterium]
MAWLTGSKHAQARRLISQLSDPARRDNAARELVRIGSDAIPALIEGLQSPDPALQSTLHEILKRMGPAAVPALAKTLQEAHPLHRATAAEILGILGERAAVPILLDALRGQYYTVRAAAASALGRIRDPRAKEPLVAALKDPEPPVRMTAVLALAAFRDPGTFPHMADLLLDDVQIEVRRAAARAFGATRDPASLRFLMEALHDSFWWYERDAAMADLLAAIMAMGEASIDPLIASLSDPEGAVRRYAATALGALRGSRAVEPLGMALYDLHHEVGVAAARALGRIGPESLEVLERASSHPEPGIRLNVALALGGMDEPRAAALLLPLLQDSDRGVQKQAILSLSGQSDTQARLALQEIAADRRDRELQSLARQALETSVAE